MLGHARVCIWRTEDNLLASVLSFHQVGFVSSGLVPLPATSSQRALLSLIGLIIQITHHATHAGFVLIPSVTHSPERASSVRVSRYASIKLLDVGYGAFNPNGVVENLG